MFPVQQAHAGVFYLHITHTGKLFSFATIAQFTFLNPGVNVL